MIFVIDIVENKMSAVIFQLVYQWMILAFVFLAPNAKMADRSTETITISVFL